MPADTRYPVGETATATSLSRGPRLDPAGEASWLLYIVECRDGSLYTGITNDLARRLKQHNDGDASRYTRSRRPVALRYQEPCGDRSTALGRELAVKLLSRREKEQLIGAAGAPPQPTRT